MLIHIYDTMPVSDIQERFSKCFPWLKIEFYDSPHHYKQASSDARQLTGDKMIGDIRRNYKEGVLEIKTTFTVRRVERLFKKEFGLNVQVFRKESGMWIQTTETDKYTLQQQLEMSCQADRQVCRSFMNSSMNINTCNNYKLKV